jgi:acetyl-CoA carboxylase biotin carboxylase subunit
MFSKILVANRGEIAIRVMRACREMGIKSVAVYSEADGKAQHVRYADEAFLLGPAPAGDSYLVFDRVIDAALRSGAEAIHPGYGFLSENPAFARKVKRSGLVFIGPKPETIKLLGDKTTARRRMVEAGVPVVPGTEKPAADLDEVRSLAEEMGYPLLLKAAAGGGGKGMRVVKEAGELDRSYRLARSEAESAFGDDRIYLEKYIDRPRHVEVQIIADRKGRVVHLGERECSIQRRHQKVIEECPSPIVDRAMRERLGQAAVKAAKSAGYLNAGTIEFLLDEKRNFYFLEVNTRLQVEHPVTEMVTGIDLVREQIRIAAGLPLGFSQKEVSWRGSAIECRIYAEDSANNFIPSVGFIRSYREPGVRVDSGLAAGDEVTVYYDPLIAKLVCWGADREQAVARMKRALEEYVITGVQTGIPLLRKVMSHESYVEADISTHFIDDNIDSLLNRRAVSQYELETLSVLACVFDYQSQKCRQKTLCAPRNSSWKAEKRRKAIVRS